jgi:peptidoglycan/xylan/chitin deacetylase (PgdA/CDA1 family)
VLEILGRFSTPAAGIHILNGHYINLVRTKDDPAQFEDLLKELSVHFDFLPFEIACNKIINQEPVLRPAIAFTFDDGFIECYDEIAPLLEKYNTNACFFINPAVIEVDDDTRMNFLRSRLLISNDKTFMTWNNISDLHNRGHVIGNHTMNHIALKGISYEDNLIEILEGKNELERRLNFECKYFAIPYGGGSDYFDDNGIKATLATHKLSFASYQKASYFFKGHNFILERRHFEGGWPINYIRYFLSLKRSFR